MRTVLSTTLCAVCLIGVSALLSNCSRTETTRARTEPVRMTNSEMERSVEAQLGSDSAYRDVKVSANADKREVTLSGKVASEDQRMRAVNAAKSAVPGAVVEDKIDVKPREMARGEYTRSESTRSEYTEDMARKTRANAKLTGDKIGKSLDDAWIHTKIAAKLMGDANTPARKINIDVENQVVTLRGHVDTPTAKAEAGRIAHETDGVKRVNNLLRIQAGG